MKTTLLLSTLAAAVLPAAAAVADYPGLEKYVYPGNYPAEREPSLHWLPDGQSYALITPDRKQVVKIDAKSGNQTEVLLDVTHTRENTIDAIEEITFSPDASKLLVLTESETLYRRSTRGAYFVYELRSRILRPLSSNHAAQQSPIFSPDSRMVAFVDSCNIFVKKIDYDTEVAVTRDGRAGSVINGVPDWTYEEEFGTTCSMAWSPDSRTLCYLRYDESRVPLYTLPVYQGACEPRDEYALYPGTFAYKYPVAGEANSTVTLHSYDIDNRKVKDVTPKVPYEYVPRIMFAPADPDNLMVFTLNRDQNRMEIVSVNPRSAVSRSVLVEECKTAWLEPCTYEMPRLLDDSFVIFSSRSGRTHLYEYAYNGTLLQQVTSGDFDVTALYGFDPARGAWYFQSNRTGTANRAVSRLDKKGKITDISQDQGIWSAAFAPGMQWLTMAHSASDTPPSTSLRAASSPEKSVRMLQDNTAELSRYADAPKREFFTLKVGANELPAMIVRPTGFNPSQKYPLVINQYSGPGSQEVLNRWNPDWTLYYASRGYVVVTVDPRGTFGKGRAFMDADYRNLGSASTADLIGAVAALADMPGIDTSRAGIFGWSFGGYQALMCATDPHSPFKAAVAVAPVTDWRFYDTAYTERYMLTPGQNPAGYRDSAPLNRVNNLRGKVLMMWGTLDDNVHPANSLEFISRAEAAGNWVEALPFINQNHFIWGCNLRAVVYARMLEHFDRNL